jgi:hypothetical protein
VILVGALNGREQIIQVCARAHAHAQTSVCRCAWSSRARWRRVRDAYASVIVCWLCRVACCILMSSVRTKRVSC